MWSAKRLTFAAARSLAAVDAVHLLLGAAVIGGVFGAGVSEVPRLPFAVLHGLSSADCASNDRSEGSETGRTLWSLLNDEKDLRDISTTKAVLLICRGHSFKDARQARGHFYEAIESIKRSNGSSINASKPEDRLTFYVVDDKSNKALSETLLTRLGIYHDRPFVIILDNFLKTERKFVSTQVGIPSTKEMQDMVSKFLEGELEPTIMGQPRPPNDRSANCKDLWEVVTDSFNEIVLDPTVDVLVEGYTPKCDACKAFGPRMRMLATLVAKHYTPASPVAATGHLKIACMNILDNDRPVAHMPEKWTPSLRLFLADGDGAAASASEAGKPKSKKKSVLFRYGSNDSTQTASGSTPTAESPTGSTSNGDEKVKVTIPSILDILRFIEKETGGRIAVTEAIVKEAEELEQEAVILERCYDQCLEFMELWAAYSEAIKERTPRRPEILVAAGLPPTPSKMEDQATAKQLQKHIIYAYKFLLHEASAGSAEEALSRLQGVSDFIKAKKVGERIEAAYDG